MRTPTSSSNPTEDHRAGRHLWSFGLGQVLLIPNSEQSPSKVWERAQEVEKDAHASPQLTGPWTKVIGPEQPPLSSMG